MHLSKLAQRQQPPCILKPMADPPHDEEELEDGSISAHDRRSHATVRFKTSFVKSGQTRNRARTSPLRCGKEAGFVATVRGIGLQASTAHSSFPTPVTRLVRNPTPLKWVAATYSSPEHIMRMAVEMGAVRPGARGNEETTSVLETVSDANDHPFPHAAAKQTKSKR